jgi:hypothetical protein
LYGNTGENKEITGSGKEQERPDRRFPDSVVLLRSQGVFTVDPFAGRDGSAIAVPAGGTRKICKAFGLLQAGFIRTFDIGWQGSVGKDKKPAG